MFAMTIAQFTWTIQADVIATNGSSGFQGFRVSGFQGFRVAGLQGCRSAARSRFVDEPG
jgi:hypothetical protein